MKVIILTSKKSWIYKKIKGFVRNNPFEGVDFILKFSENRIPEAELCFILGYYKKVSPKTLNKFKKCLVIHESNLPEGRGWSPLSWQIEEGKNSIPIVLFEANDKVDSGKIYLKSTINLKGYELLEEIKEKQWEETEKLITDFIKKYPEILKKGKEQKGTPTYFRRRTGEDNRLDPYKSIADQFNKLRVCDNEMFPAWFILNGKKYILKIYREVK